MFLVGLVDDVLSLKPSTKLIAQIALRLGRCCSSAIA